MLRPNFYVDSSIFQHLLLLLFARGRDWMGWEGKGCDGKGWDGKGREGMAWEGKGQMKEKTPPEDRRLLGTMMG